MEEESRLEKVGENIWLCDDGVYRWYYEFDLKRNPTIFLTLLKVLGIAFGAVFLFELILDLAQGVISSWGDAWRLIRFFLIVTACIVVLGLISYVILGVFYGWKYLVLFEMNDNGLRHIQMPKQFKKAQALGWISAAVSLASGSIGGAAPGILSASRATQDTTFSRVRRIRTSRRTNTIYLNQPLIKNQAYASGPDFDFVERYIREHCPNAKG
ncbi:MAG: hypothetical protein J6P31_02475 [Oscillospiraceae bacterium]|nr:hypothetical protein [Oscillospiraceae bacterium]